jgi:ABC-type polysaccharide/polyol phosphate transport system ATPase subunit
MRGRVGALIALGAGFNPILTGRENIYINGSVLGLTKKEPERWPPAGRVLRLGEAARRNRKPGKAEGRATAGWPEGRSIGDDASQRCRRQARRASRVGRTANQIDAKIDEIIDFAEIREFIDTPVQSYSSGMTVRLGFAVATKLAFGFLVVNEVVLA